MQHLIKLFAAGFELTTGCPCRCDTCGSDAGVRRQSELTAAEWLEQLEAVHELGGRRICLLGGEPFLHPAWSSLVRAGNSRGIDVDLISCGVGISDAIVDEARDCDLHWITISVDGTEQIHEALRRVRGGFRECLDAVRRFDRAGLRVGVTTQVNRRTLPTLEELAGQLEAAGAIGWQLQLTQPSGRARLHPELILQPTDLPDLFAVLRRLMQRRGLRPYITDDIGYMTRDDPGLRTPPMCPARCWCGCSAGLRAIGITSIGDVKGCLSLPNEFVEGNVRSESLATIWRDPSRFAYNRLYQPEHLSAACRACGVAPVCRGGCSSMSVAATGKSHQGTYCARLQGIS